MNASSPKFLLSRKVASGKFIPVAKGRALRLLLTVTLVLISAHRLPAPIFETPEKPPSKPGTSVNADGSQTVYEVDSVHHTALATITERSGKLREKIRYELDGAGRFTSRMIFDPDGKLRSKSVYKYDKAGRLLEETLLGKDDAVLHKIAYSYDQSGKQTGHSVFDGNGKLLDQTSAVSPSRSPPRRAFEGGVPGG
jgi:YD repeat-containing protein